MKKIYIFLSSLFIFVSSLITSYANVTPYHVVLDAGHGGMDGGSNVGDIKESDLVLEIVLNLKEILEKNGFIVTLTRTSKDALCEGKFIKKVDMNNRIKIINNSNADLALSIHLNYYSDSKYRGAQVFYSDNNEQNYNLAFSIQNTFINELRNTNRKVVVRNNIYLLNRVLIPICIIECGFMSNFNELTLLKTKEYQQSLSIIIMNGIISYLNR